MKYGRKKVLSLLLCAALLITAAACAAEAEAPQESAVSDAETAPVSFDLSPWLGVFYSDLGSVTITAPESSGAEFDYAFAANGAKGSGTAGVTGPTEAGNKWMYFALLGDELLVDDLVVGAGSFGSFSGTCVRGETQEDTSAENMTEARAVEIHDIMSPYFTQYLGTNADAWLRMSDAEKSEAYAVFLEMIEKLGLKAGASEAEWIEGIAEDIEYYGLFYAASSAMLGNEEMRRLNYYTSAYHYIKGVQAGNFRPLPPGILAAADNLTIENRRGQYLLCTGGDHVILQTTKEWTTLDVGFMQSGSVFPQGTEDGGSLPYMLSGSDGRLTTASFGKADLIPVFKAMGAIADDGALVHEQIQISALSSFDAPALYVMSEESADVTRMALVRYSPADGLYVWDGNMLAALGRCCFGASGDFYFVDENRSFCSMDGSGAVTILGTADDFRQVSTAPD